MKKLLFLSILLVNFSFPMAIFNDDIIDETINEIWPNPEDPSFWTKIGEDHDLNQRKLKKYYLKKWCVQNNISLLFKYGAFGFYDESLERTKEIVNFIKKNYISI